MVGKAVLCAVFWEPLRLPYQKKKAATAESRINPPMTPPAMAPAGDDDFEEEAADAEEVDVEELWAPVAAAVCDFPELPVAVDVNDNPVKFGMVARDEKVGV